MFDEYEDETGKRGELWRRVRTVVIGSVVALLAGSFIVSLYTYFQYGGTPFDSLLGRREKQSPAIGKLAFDKTNSYLGVIRGEGYSQRRGKVYYIEQAGGQMIERAIVDIEVREPKKRDE
jgi:hypothetical protein